MSDQDDRNLYARLLGFFSAEERAGVSAVGIALTDAAGGVARIGHYKVMVAYGGGKDSTYVVAFVRAVQLHLQLEHGATFTLRVANMRHAGVPLAVMENIDRVYTALRMPGDDRTELLTVDHTLVRPFRVDLPLPAELIAVNRVDVLMNGHRSAGDGRPTFCNSCNLAVADFYGRAAWCDGGVDAIITGDSRREQALYAAWILRLAKETGIAIDRRSGMVFADLLSALRGIGDAYYRELFGAGADAELTQREVAVGDRSVQPQFVSVFDKVSYRVHDHWDLIVDFLGFRFDDLAFSFTESDCANPTLMAHLRGLRVELVEGRSYAAGIGEYLEFAEAMMRKKEMPDRLIELALGRYDTPEKIDARREVAAAYAARAFGLSEDALAAMVFSPFTDRGERLASFLARCHPERIVELEQLHDALRGAPGPLIDWLESVSGLSADHLRTLYHSALVDFSRSDTVMARVRAGDPHKHRVRTVDARTGAQAIELISGR
ncbi:hypothetical protein D5S18_26180 [Nocardia panacis]|uniref:PqqD family protein n=1 Tax=Nocardia panacis TaxID=2340916 RepID=A0A3A4K7N0_9NOCA|nr:hypothetical protein [Nocardia panacis]RJO70697.1 hypothetical protein D5S18_26180 [Nocardia panacis]